MSVSPDYRLCSLQIINYFSMPAAHITVIINLKIYSLHCKWIYNNFSNCTLFMNIKIFCYTNPLLLMHVLLNIKIYKNIEVMNKKQWNIFQLVKENKAGRNLKKVFSSYFLWNYIQLVNVCHGQTQWSLWVFLFVFYL